MRYYCNNCGVYGHSFSKCMLPITSLGIIAYRNNDINTGIEYLLIRRKDSMGFVDFMRGKYNINNDMYLQNIVDVMTINEKNMITQLSFDDLWDHLWNHQTLSSRYRNEYDQAKKKFNTIKSGYINHNNEIISVDALLEKSTTNWIEPEWGFPKGRRNFKENDLTCALREFSEETGVNSRYLHLIHNLLPYDEVFIGSNFKTYRSRYFIGKINNDVSNCMKKQDSEVGDIFWCSYQNALDKIRSTSKEKLELIRKVNECLSREFITV